jgi:hypothetical protein
LILGKSTMPNKILVCYASRADSTGGVAETIGKTLTGFQFATHLAY